MSRAVLLINNTNNEEIEKVEMSGHQTMYRNQTNMLYYATENLSSAGKEVGGG